MNYELCLNFVDFEVYSAGHVTTNYGGISTFSKAGLSPLINFFLISHIAKAFLRATV